MRSRLQQLLGPASPWVLKPKRSAVSCLVAWLISLPLTWQHPLLALLGFCAIWGLTLALWLEAPLLQSLPSPPLTVLLIGLCLRWGLGPLLLSVGGSGGDEFLEIWIRYGPQAQFLWMSITAALLLLAPLQQAAIARAAQSQPLSSWLEDAAQRPRLRAQLTILACVLSIYMASYIILSILSGAFDRQFEVYARWTEQLWRFDTPVIAFSRLRDLWFLLFPLWWQLLSRAWRWILGCELLLFFLAALLSGSRGLLFYPALMLLFGLWFVLRDTRKLRNFALSLVILVFVLSPLIYVVRDSIAFQKAQGWSGRLQAVGSALLQPDHLLDKARWLGRDLYACHDPLLFAEPNISSPRVGSDGLNRLALVWLPKHLYPERPVIFDGHVLAKQLHRQYQGSGGEAKHWFPCLSLGGDLFRRWSFPGVLIGSFVIATSVHFLLGLWYRCVTIRGDSFQLLIVLLPATYLQSFPFGTVSETVWALLWELPKYLVLLWVLGAGIDGYLARRAP